MESWSLRILVFVSPQGGTAKLSGRNYDFREPTKAGANRKERRSQWKTSKRTRKSLNRQNQEMTLEPVEIFGLFKVTSFIVTTVNLEINSMCRKKKFPYSTEIYGCYEVHSHRYERDTMKAN